MKLPLLLALPLLAALSGLRNANCAEPDKWRPRFHFTPEKNWVNDPNGLVYYDGEYHLFTQYNPQGDRWGHMSWGHAVSRDLARWEHLPLALPEGDDAMIFSGSAVVDWANSSGFGKGDKPPMVAIYTAHHTKKPLQNQHVAYSTDRGRTWTKFAGNPVLDIGDKDFRDPKVFWHADSKRWVMAVAWPTHHQVRLYGSPNLKEWTHLSDFGPAGSVNGIWECPDLFPLTVEGKDGGRKWVMVVNVGSGAPAGGSGCQYFVGDFDGAKFTADAQKGPLWADWGRDFYAAVSFSDVPKEDGRRLWLGWMSNWEYANDTPTAPFRGAMTVPRELALRNTPDGLRLVQRPAKELEALRGERVQVALEKVAGKADLATLAKAVAGPFELGADIEPTADAAFELTLSTGANEATVLRVDVAAQKLTLDRTRSGAVDFHKAFPGSHSAPLRLIDGRLKLRLLVDTSSVELFAADGETSLTSLVFPGAGERHLGLTVTKGALTRGSVAVWPLAVKAEKPAGLPRSSPEQQGVSSAGVRAFVEAADAKVNTMHSFMLVRHGHVVAEGWWKPQAAETPHVLHSLSKSFTSTAVGFAVEDGKLSVDDPVLKFFPDLAPAEPSKNLKAMRVRDLLTMSTGHQVEVKFTPDVPWAKAFLAHPVPFKPGSHFQYNTPATYMLSAIVQKVTGETVLDYLQPRLFDPLGIPKPQWGSSPQGITLGGYGLYLRTEDIAKFGQLYLQGGKWHGKQVVPAAWVKAATARQMSNGSDPKSDWDQGYGFQFWRSQHGAFRGDGAAGQFCVVLPEQDAVVAITADTGDMQGQLNLVWDKLLPALRDKPLPEDKAEQERLRQALGGLVAKEKKGAGK